MLSPSAFSALSFSLCLSVAAIYRFFPEIQQRRLQREVEDVCETKTYVMIGLLELGVLGDAVQLGRWGIGIFKSFQWSVHLVDPSALTVYRP